MERIDEIARRIVERKRDQRDALARQFGTDNLPGVQSHEAKEVGPVPQCDGKAGRAGLALLALRRERGGVV